MLDIGVLSLMFLLPVAVSGQPGPPTDEEAIRTVMDRFMDAWNRHDAKAFAAEFSNDADFTNVRGVAVSGRSNIEAFHAPVFATIFKSSNQKYTDIKTRFIRRDVAAVDVHWELTGQTDPAGNALPARNGQLILVMTKESGGWQIVVMHNQDLTAQPHPVK